jgi:hypothetical protein
MVFLGFLHFSDEKNMNFLCIMAMATLTYSVGLCQININIGCVQKNLVPCRNKVTGIHIFIISSINSTSPFSSADPKNTYAEFKPCSLLHSPPPQLSLEDPLFLLAKPTDIPLLVQQARSYDAHLRYHAVEQLYLLFLRHDLRMILEEVGLAEVCIDTLARKQADSRTRHLCTHMIKLILMKDIHDIYNNMWGSWNESSPKTYLKKGTGKLYKLLAPYKVHQKSASEKYVVAYNMWSSSIKKVLAFPCTKQVLALPYKKTVIKSLAEGIRVCKKGCMDAAGAKASKDEKRSPSHLFGKMAAEVLKESADNLNAHLVAVFCEELKGDYEEAVTVSTKEL